MAYIMGTLCKLLTVLALVCGFSGWSSAFVACKINTRSKVKKYKTTLNASSSVTLTCMVVSSSLAQNFTWVKDERVMKKDTGIKRVSNLPLFNITVANGGKYFCVARSGNREGRCHLNIYVNALPKIVQPVRLFELVMIGSTLAIPCRATGWPVPIVSWFRDGQKIRNSQNGFYITTNKDNHIALNIDRMMKTYEGKFICVATNSIGQDSKRIELKSYARPHVPYQSQVKAISAEVICTLGARVSLHCQGYRFRVNESYFYWMFNGRSSRQNPRWYTSMNYKPMNIENLSVVNFSLLIINVSSADLGTYTCFAEWIYGTPYNASMNLHVEKEAVKDDELPDRIPSIVYWMIAAGVFAGALLMGLVAYLLRKGKTNYRESFQVDSESSKYDVFVSYSSKDFSWVQQNLLPLLDTYQLKYCIHSRDFEAGKPILDNMADSVFRSHVTLAIISSNYVTSKFCQEELSMAVCKSKATKLPSLVAVRIDSVSRKKLPKTLRRTTFLDCVDSSERQTWNKRLVKYLQSQIETSKFLEKRV